jgi:hypothetical protein
MSLKSIGERIERLHKEFNSLPCTKEGLKRAYEIGQAVQHIRQSED